MSKRKRSHASLVPEAAHGANGADLARDVIGLSKQAFVAADVHARRFLRGLSLRDPALGLDGSMVATLERSLSTRAAALGLDARIHGPLACRDEKGSHVAMLAVFVVSADLPPRDQDGRDDRPQAGFFGYVIVCHQRRHHRHQTGSCAGRSRSDPVRHDPEDQGAPERARGRQKGNGGEEDGMEAPERRELEGHIRAVHFDRSPRLPPSPPDAQVRSPSASLLIRPCGVAAMLLEFLDRDADPMLGVRRQTLRADLAGRYVWARHGFLFDPRGYYFDVDGAKASASEIARANLVRFLDAHGLALDDLVLRGEPIRSLEDLRTPADFAQLVHRDGRAHVTVRPLCAACPRGTYTAERVDLPIGKAFMLADYRASLPLGDPPADRVVRSRGGLCRGTRFAVDAMPYWDGYREPSSTPSSPSPPSFPLSSISCAAVQDPLSAMP